MNTADLHPKRLELSLSIGELRRLLHELESMEHAPHQARVPPDKQLERDRAGEQLIAHLSVLVNDTRERPEGERVSGSLPLLRSSAKYLLTACDRCRRAALLSAHAALDAGSDAGALVDEVRTWDGAMRLLGGQHGVSSPLRELVEPLALSPADLARLGLDRERLFNGEELLARF